VIHDIIPTNEGLAAIHLVDTDACRRCGKMETLQHHVTECKEGAAIWEWAQRRMAMMLRTDQRHIPAQWTLHRPLHFLPPRRQRTLLWTLAHLVWYRLQGWRRQSLADFIDLLRRSRWNDHTERSA